MIKRSLAFLLLLVAGFAVLYVVTGDDTMARFGGSAPEIEKIEDPTPPQDGFVVPLDNNNVLGDQVELAISGEITFSPTRDLPLRDGTILQLPIYELRAAGSRRLEDGRQELIDVEVVFFEIRGSEAAPEALEAGTLLADRAILELGQNEKGDQSVMQDKDIHLFGATLVTGADARVKNLKLAMEEATVRVTDDRMRIATIRDDDPVWLELAHEQGPVTLEGRGLNARFPLNASNDGDSVLQNIEVEITHDPVLIHQGARGESRLRAAGPLRYVEDPVTETARVSIDGGVEFESHGLLSDPSSKPDSAAEPVIAFGDHLRAKLLRGEDPSGTSARLRWSEMQLIGRGSQRAGIRGQGMHLECDTIVVVPNRGGEPWLVTANGTPTLSQTVDGRAMNFEAAERIHLVRLPAHLGPWLGGRGWGRMMPGSDPTQLLIFTGRSVLRLPHEDGELVLESERGLRVLRGDATDGPLSVLGLGNVDLATTDTRSPLTVTGNDGFLMHAGPKGQDMRLGPAAAGGEHRFEVKSGELVVRGSGSCQLFRPSSPEQLGDIDLRSPDSDIDVNLETGGALRGAAVLTASFNDEGLQRFDAEGPGCRLEWHGDDEHIEGWATRIRSTDPSSFQLWGAPARVVSDRGTLEGNHIRIVRLTEKDTKLVARGAASLAGSELVDGKAENISLELDAEEITYLPFLVPQRAAAQMPIPWPTDLPPVADNIPYLIAKGTVAIRQLDEAGEVISRANGDVLVLQLGEETTGSLRGKPAKLARRDKAGQDITGEAPEILLRGAKAQRVSLRASEELRPLFTVANRSGEMRGFGTSDGFTKIVCEGDVEVTEREIMFLAPVEVTSHTRDGELDTDGFHLNAERMRMIRSEESGEIESIVAEQGTELQWRGMDVTCQELGLDLATHTCTVVAAGPEEPARIVLPDKFRGRCSGAEFNYLTYDTKAWHVIGEGDKTRE